MSKYQITHSCGHTAEHNICGTNVHGERERRVAQLEKQVCVECYRKQQQAAAAAETADLPALTGTDKQVAWATSIRAAAAADLRALRSTAQAWADKGDANAVRAIDIIDAALAVTESSRWIDSRGTKFDRAWLARKLAK